MRNSIAAPLNDKFASDGEYDARFIDGRNASASAGELKTALAAHRPVFVATTSHGMTGPLNDVPRMQADLGLLVDAGFKMVRPQDLLGGAARRRDLVRARLLLGRQPLDDGIQSSGAGGLECR
jgi:hypothetical protein